jgi:hypothetical protein
VVKLSPIEYSWHRMYTESMLRNCHLNLYTLKWRPRRARKTGLKPESLPRPGLPRPNTSCNQLQASMNIRIRIRSRIRIRIARKVRHQVPALDPMHTGGYPVRFRSLRLASKLASKR